MLQIDHLLVLNLPLRMGRYTVRTLALNLFLLNYPLKRLHVAHRTEGTLARTELDRVVLGGLTLGVQVHLFHVGRGLALSVRALGLVYSLSLFLSERSAFGLQEDVLVGFFALRVRFLSNKF